MRAMEIVFGVPYLFIVTVLVRIFKMQYGQPVHLWSLLYVLLAKTSEGDIKAVAKGSLPMKL